MDSVKQKMVFKYTSTYDRDFKLELSTNAEDLSQILEDFESFLKGCGFVFEGHIDIFNDNED